MAGKERETTVTKEQLEYSRAERNYFAAELMKQFKEEIALHSEGLRMALVA